MKCYLCTKVSSLEFGKANAKWLAKDLEDYNHEIAKANELSLNPLADFIKCLLIRPLQKRARDQEAPCDRFTRNPRRFQRRVVKALQQRQSKEERGAFSAVVR